MPVDIKEYQGMLITLKSTRRIIHWYYHNLVDEYIDKIFTNPMIHRTVGRCNRLDQIRIL